jgi:hypothetical protein
LRAFAVSLLRTASERQRGFVALFVASATVPTTQMHALLAPHLFSSSPLHDAVFFFFLAVCFAAAVSFVAAGFSADAAEGFAAGTAFLAVAVCFFAEWAFAGAVVFSTAVEAAGGASLAGLGAGAAAGAAGGGGGAASCCGA